MTEVKAVAEIIKLKDVRKRKARAEKEARAARNRAAHGRSKAEKQRDTAERAQSEAQLEHHRLDDDDKKTED